MEPSEEMFHSPPVLEVYRGLLSTLKPKKAQEYKEALLKEREENVKLNHQWIITADVFRVAKALKIRIPKGI